MTTKIGKQYKVVNGTYYDSRTPQEVIDILERSRLNKTRLRLHYGTTEEDGEHPVGRDWGDEYDVTGHVGRSTGDVKIPLLIYNSRSMGGGGILDYCIVRIRTSSGNQELYRHPSYHQGTPELRDCDVDGLKCEVYVDGELRGRFFSRLLANNWLQKMGFER